jgi:hypothetical protein
VWYKALFDGTITTPEPDITAGFFLYNPLQSQIANPPDFDQNLKLLAWYHLLENFFTFDVVGKSYVGRTVTAGGTNLGLESYQQLTPIQQRRERILIEGIVFQNCCDDFDPQFKVTITPIDGNTEVRIVERATHDLQKDTITTNIKF